MDFASKKNEHETISTLSGNPRKLVDQFMHLGIYIKSAEKDVNMLFPDHWSYGNLIKLMKWKIIFSKL